MVPPRHRQGALPDRRHVVADGDRRHHDRAAAGRDADEARLRDAAAPGIVPGGSHAATGKPLGANQGGYLGRHAARGPACCAPSTAIPSATRSSTGARCPGIYFTGDGARRDADGYFWVMGRIDDVVNVAGHRLGTMEVESALVSHPSVAEAAVVGRPDDLKGQAIAAFVTARSPASRRPRSSKKTLKEHVAEEIGAFARPGRHPLHRLAAEDAQREDHAPAAARHRRRARRPLGDTTTLEDYSVLAKLREDEE